MTAPGISLPDFRKDITVDVFNEAGQLVISYHMYRCWVSEYNALPALDAATAATAIQIDQDRDWKAGSATPRSPSRKS